jgi:NAD(P)-dependent dehydrogenase (short-subunit alcohol dehydrogenase family)
VQKKNATVGIIGAGGFIGGEIAKKFASEGFTVFVGRRFAAFASAKFGLRAVAQSIARELGPKNIHVAHLVIDASVDTEWVRHLIANREGRRRSRISTRTAWCARLQRRKHIGRSISSCAMLGRSSTRSGHSARMVGERTGGMGAFAEQCDRASQRDGHERRDHRRRRQADPSHQRTVG